MARSSATKPPTSRVHKQHSNIKFSDEELEHALLKEQGILNRAAKVLGVERRAVADRIALDKERWQPIVDAGREQVIDLAEHTVLRGLRSTDLNVATRTAQYVLDTIGKARGYVKRQEVTGANGGAIVVDLTGAGD